MNDDKPRVCGAKTRAGTPCQRSPMDNGRCNLHGGKTPRGVASPHWKDGRHSKYQPTGKLLDQYNRAVSDPSLLSVEDEAALIQARIAMLIEGTAVSSGQTWDKLETMWNTLVTAVADGDEPTQLRLVREITDVFRLGKGERDQWEEITKLSEAKRRIVKDEREYRMKSVLMLTIEQLWAIQTQQLQEIRDALYRHTDRQTALAVLRELQQRSESIVVQPTE